MTADEYTYTHPCTHTHTHRIRHIQARMHTFFLSLSLFSEYHWYFVIYLMTADALRSKGFKITSGHAAKYVIHPYLHTFAHSFSCAYLYFYHYPHLKFCLYLYPYFFISIFINIYSTHSPNFVYYSIIYLFIPQSPFSHYTAVTKYILIY